MEKRDYLLREIEKIGIFLKMLLGKLIRSEGQLPALEIEKVDEAKRELLHATGLDLEVLCSLDNSEMIQYLSRVQGMQGPNLELLGDVLKAMGMKSGAEDHAEYLQRAVRLYEECNTRDKTFSFDRESKIREIKNTLIP